MQALSAFILYSHNVPSEPKLYLLLRIYSIPIVIFYLIINFLCN